MASVEEADKMGKMGDKIGEKYNKKLPHRLGIAYEVGARLEAQDYLLKWYPSRIEKVDPDEGKILIHFERWNHRYDEWIDCNSPRLRPLQRTSLRREGLKQEEPTVGAVPFKVGDEVLARWIDCRYYPAKIVTINKEDTYSVRFYDGFVKDVKSINVKEMPEDLKNQDWTAIVKSTVEAQALEQAANKSRARAGHHQAVHQQTGQQAAHVEEEEEEGARKGRRSDAEEGSESEKALPQPQKQRSAEARQPASLLQSKVMAAKKRKSAFMGAFQAKRARLNQLTGILASKLSRRRDADVQDSKERPSEAVENKETSPLNSTQPSGSPGQLSSPDRGLSPASATSDSPGRRRRPSALSESSAHDRTQTRTEDASSSSKSEMLSADAKRRERDRSKDKKEKEKDVSKSKKKKKKKKKTRKESTDGASVADSVDSLSLGLEETSGNADDSQDEDGAGGDEIVRCSCGINEETGFMIQCEMCSCWQHSVCMGFTEENIPDRYSCHVCQDPPGQRWSARFAFERDWLVEGRLQSFSFARDSYWSRHAASFAALQRLLADMHRVHEVIHGLKLKIHIAKTEDRSDLMLWASPWRTERIKTELISLPENDSRLEACPALLASTNDGPFAGLEGVNGVNSSQVPPGKDSEREVKADSPSESTYITSEHCYQKPQGAGPAAARAANARAWRECAGRDGDSGSDTTYAADSGRTNTAGSFIYGLDATYCSAAGVGNCENNGGGSSSDETPSVETGAGSGMEEEGGPSLGAAGLNSGAGWKSAGHHQLAGGVAQQHLCLSELLLHVEALQDDVAKRMDFLEEQLTTLEGMFESTCEQSSELELRLPRVKRSLRQMAADLQKLQQLSTLCA
ncbi:PHD finger protein 20-like protein 1 isoform X6 [Lethenteron reissneri]|uniref:PHD finger protein 20-like protein 1 isoform X6 n=1 Tax=Lethenteron reissneri TaxID=7753 RepID=UPI002AB604D2|nr:PHD finger protein 20-like protein 1 isoform X6 [Lethenteron reissneri]